MRSNNMPLFTLIVGNPSATISMRRRLQSGCRSSAIRFHEAGALAGVRTKCSLELVRILILQLTREKSEGKIDGYASGFDGLGC